jgi:hypothetical protein
LSTIFSQPRFETLVFVEWTISVGLVSRSLLLVDIASIELVHRAGVTATKSLATDDSNRKSWFPLFQSLEYLV